MRAYAIFLDRIAKLPYPAGEFRDGVSSDFKNKELRDKFVAAMRPITFRRGPRVLICLFRSTWKTK